jgi:lipoprotein-anchoring transpeptidase ErfK/SrfK
MRQIAARQYPPAMRRFLLVLAITCIAATGASANVVITIDKSHQRMSVSVNGEDRYNWPISTARAGYNTPNGTYHPEHLAKRWFSHKYYGSPMPHAIFYDGGFAIHGSYETGRLGRAASHGCVRLHPEHAATLFALVQEEGLSSTDIVITGSDPPAPRYAQPRWPFYAYRGFFGRF